MAVATEKCHGSHVSPVSSLRELLEKQLHGQATEEEIVFMEREIANLASSVARVNRKFGSRVVQMGPCSEILAGRGQEAAFAL